MVTTAQALIQCVQPVIYTAKIHTIICILNRLRILTHMLLLSGFWLMQHMEILGSMSLILLKLLITLLYATVVQIEGCIWSRNLEEVIVVLLLLIIVLANLGKNISYGMDSMYFCSKSLTLLWSQSMPMEPGSPIMRWIIITVLQVFSIWTLREKYKVQQVGIIYQSTPIQYLVQQTRL